MHYYESVVDLSRWADKSDISPLPPILYLIYTNLNAEEEVRKPKSKVLVQGLRVMTRVGNNGAYG